MASKNKPPPPTPQTQLPTAAPHDDLPVVMSIGLTKAKTGWVAFLLTSQGTQILETELLCPPCSRPAAAEKARLELVTRFLLPTSSMKA